MGDSGTSVSQKSKIPKEFKGSIQTLLGSSLAAGAAGAGNQLQDFDLQRFFKKGEIPEGFDLTTFLPAPYEGEFIANADPLQVRALEERAALGEQLQGFADPYLNLVQRQISGEFLDPTANPYLQGAIQAAIDPVRQQYAEYIAPTFESQAIDQGAYQGSSRRDLVENQLANQFDQNALNLAGQIAYENYVRERDIQQRGGEQLDIATRLQQLPSVLLGEAGAGFQAIRQQELDDAFRQYTEQIVAPFRVLDPLGNLIQGTQGVPLNQLATRQGNPVATGITGALSGASSGSALNQAIFGTGAGAGYPGTAAVLGGILGGLGGVLGG